MAKVLLIGLNHMIQRSHPDDRPQDVEKRAAFEETLRGLIVTRKLELVAEEAGDDIEWAENLQRVQDEWAASVRVAPKRIEPQETVARRLLREIMTCRHVDIRPEGRAESKDLYENQMFDRTVAEVNSEMNFLVLCGETHREPLSRRFAELRWDVEGYYLE